MKHRILCSPAAHLALFSLDATPSHELPARRLCKLQVLARCCKKSCHFGRLPCVSSPMQMRLRSVVDVPTRPDTRFKLPVTRVCGRRTHSHTHTCTSSVSSQALRLSSGISLIRTQAITGALLAAFLPSFHPAAPATVYPSHHLSSTCTIHPFHPPVWRRLREP